MSQTDTTTGDTQFDPSRFLRKLSGKDYLEVKWRLLWLRTEQPDAIVETELHAMQDDFALFKARVSIPGCGSATGWGSETKQDFGDFIEKAETKALGRALAALGFGTQFCDDHVFDPEDRGKVVDSPVERPGGNHQGGGLATPAQLKLIYLTATRELQISEEELDQRCNAQFGRLPLHLTKREASELIDALKSGAFNAPAPAQPAPQQSQPAPAPAPPAGPTDQQAAAELEEWGRQWVAKMMSASPRELKGKARTDEVNRMKAHLVGGGVPEIKLGALCKLLHETATAEELPENTPVSTVLDARLVLALGAVGTGELYMLSRIAKSL